MSTGDLISILPMPEVLQEFRVQTAPFDASVGHFMGAQVSMVTKSGSNAVHGSATYQYNGRPLNSVPFFPDTILHTGPISHEKIEENFPASRANRYRGTVSGPAYIPKLYDGRNRTFFTVGMDYFARVFVPNISTKTVPTAPERNGDFSALLALGSQYQIYDPATIAPAAGGRFSRQPLPNNIIPASRIDPIAKGVLNYYPLPNTPGTVDGLNNYIGSPVNRPTHHNYFGRFDEVVTSNQRLFVSYQHTLEHTPQQTSGFPSDFLGLTNYNPGYIVTVDDVISLRPNLVLDLRLGMSRIVSQNLPESLGFNLTTLGLPASLVDQLNPRLTTLPQIAFDQVSTIGSNVHTFFQTNYYYFIGSVAHNRGNHNLRFGAEYRIYQENGDTFGFVSPSYTFGNTWTRGPLDNSPVAPNGQGLASFLFGLPTAGEIDTTSSFAEQSDYFATFLQDDWKVSRKLTVSVGLRYELELPTTERFNRANRGFDFTTPNPIQAAAQANFAANPVSGVGSLQTPGGLLFAGGSGQPRGIWNTDAHTFLPRIGLAYQIHAQTVVRAGYRVFFTNQGADRYNVPQIGFSQATQLTPSLNNGQTFQATFENPFPNGFLGAPGSSLGLQTTLGQPLTLIWPDRRPGYAQRWSTNIQHELHGRVLLEAGYVGNRGTGLDMTQDLNALPAQYMSTSPARDNTTINYLTAAVPNPFAGLPQFAGSNLTGQTVARSQLLLPYPEFGALTTTLSGGFSWYHALQLRAEKRMSGGFTVQASYTWSKFMEAITKLNPTDAGPSHSISTLDRPQRFVASGIYELPVGKGRRFLTSARPWLDQIVGGWSGQAIFQVQSGPAIGFGDIIFNGNLHSIVLPPGQRTLSQWFNVNAGFNRNSAQQLLDNIRTFPLALAGLRAGGINNWDISLFKGFQITEKVNFQLRAEAQDAFNTPEFSPPNTNPSSTLFGQVSSTVSGQQRQIYVGARLMF